MKSENNSITSCKSIAFHILMGPKSDRIQKCRSRSSLKMEQMNAYGN